MLQIRQTIGKAADQPNHGVLCYVLASSFAYLNNEYVGKVPTCIEKVALFSKVLRSTTVSFAYFFMFPFIIANQAFLSLIFMYFSTSNLI